MNRRFLAFLLSVAMILSLAPAAYAADRVLITTGVTPPEGGTATNSAYYDRGSNASLTARANSGYTFEFWYDGDTGESFTSSAITIVADRDRTMIASFRKDGEYYISSPDFPFSPTPHTKGTVEIRPLADSYAPGALITAYNSPASGYRFVRYEISQDSDVGSDEAVYTPVTGNTFRMPAHDIWLRGVFYSTTPHNITVDCGQNGTASISPAQNSYLEGDVVTVTITPNSGYSVSRVTGFPPGVEQSGNVNTSVDLTFVMPGEDVELSAEFYQRELTEVAVIAYPEDSADFTTQADASGYVTVTAQPKPGYEFKYWFLFSDTSTEIYQNPYTFAPRQADVLVGVFDYTAGHIIRQNVARHGSFTYDPIGQSTHPAGSTITINAVPDEGYAVKSYMIAEIIGQNEVQNITELDGNTFRMPDYDTLIIVLFDQPFDISVTASPAQGGRVSGGGSCFAGDDITVSAYPEEGYRFVNWTQNGSEVSRDAAYTFQAIGARDLTANFEPIPPSYDINVYADPAQGGSVNGGGMYVSGAYATVTAEAFTGYRFVGWTEGGSVVSTQAAFTFEVTRARDLTAGFEAVPTYAVSVSASPATGGAVTGGGVYSEGAEATVTAEAATGYRFVSWTEGGSVVSTQTSYTFTVAQARDLTANFASVPQYAVSVSASPATGGAVTGGGMYFEGAAATVTAVPERGFLFVSWTEGGNVVSTQAAFTFEVTRARDLTAVFTSDLTPFFPGEGSGTLMDPYMIRNVQELLVFRDIVNGTGSFINDCNPSACAHLDADLDLSGEAWTPISDPGHKYSGLFRGFGHKIYNLNNTGSAINEDYVGLFGYIAPGGTVEKVELVGGRISGNKQVGGIAGENDGTISGCKSSCAVSGYREVGGIAGHCEYAAKVEDCHNTADISGESEVGGVVGHSENKMSYCSNAGGVTASNRIAGGVAGWNDWGSMDQCFNTGAVSAGNQYAGGITGCNTNGRITNSYNTGSVYCRSMFGGGITGSSTGATGSLIQYCHSSGEMTQPYGSAQGAIAGSNKFAIANCYFNASTSGRSNAVGTSEESSTLTSVSAISASGYGEQSSFEGFDFVNIWVMCSGGPRLRRFSNTVDSWQAIKTALETPDTRMMILTADATAGANDDALLVRSGYSVELDLNGHTVDRGLTSVTPDGWVFCVEGELTISDSSGGSGRITGGYSSGFEGFSLYGGGIYVGGSGKLILNGGTIAGNVVEVPEGSSAYPCGGGVYNGGTFIMNGGAILENRANDRQFARIAAQGGGVYNDGTFIMNGGRISSNVSSDDGGGVYNAGTFTMNGGEISSNVSGGEGGGVYTAQRRFTMNGGRISGNEATEGGGVLLRYEVMNVSGNASVTGNTGGNVKLGQSNKISVTGALDRNARIGVTPRREGVFTEGLSGRGGFDNFFPNDAGLVTALNDEGEAVMIRVFSVTITSAAADHMTLLSGSERQSVLSGASMGAIVYAAEDGWYFPDDYAPGPRNGISVSRDSYTQITISGVPTGDAAFTLTSPAIKLKADTPTLTAIQPSVIGGAGSVPTTAVHEFRGDAGFWMPCGGGLTDLDPGTYYVRVAETGYSYVSDPQEIVIEEFVPEKRPTPSAVFTATGYDSGVISGLAEGGQYAISGAGLSGISAAASGGAVTIASGISAGTLSIVHRGDYVTTVDGGAQTIAVTRAETPALEAVQPERDIDGGAIPTTAVHEISADGAVWTACAGGSADLAPGEYRVRVAASGTVLASEPQVLYIMAYSEPAGPEDQTPSAGAPQESPGVTVASDKPVTAAELERILRSGDVLTVVADDGTKATLGTEALKELAQAGGDAVVSIKTGSDGSVTLEVSAGGKPVDVTAKIEFPAASDGGKVVKAVSEGGSARPVAQSFVEGGKAHAVVRSGEKIVIADAAAPSYPDVNDDDWFAEAVAFVTSLGLFKGTGSGFDPDGTMTAAMLTTVLYRLDGANAGEDVPGRLWYADAVDWAEENDIAIAEGADFAPDEPIIRQDIAVMFFRYAKLIGLDTTVRAPLEGFADGAALTGEAREAMSWAVSAGLFLGNTKNELNPGDAATRAEIAILFERFVKLIAG